MHYIPFINEDPKNRYEDLNCRNCPMFEGSTVYNMKIVCTCPFNGGYTEEFDIDQKVIQLKQAITRNCPVRYRNPVEDFHFFQVYCNLTSEFARTFKEWKEDEDNKELLDKRDNVMKCLGLMETIFPEKFDRYQKIMHDGYKLDENMNLYK